MRSETTKRFVRDESGMTMALAVIMIVLIGVMGAGLLTFVITDLRAVVEVNQGQRAFEIADSGVQAAKRQIINDCVVDDGCAENYDSMGTDIQWSASTPNTSCGTAGNTGMCLLDLDQSSATDDRVNVQIKSVIVASGGTGSETGTFDTGDRNCGLGGSTVATPNQRPVVQTYVGGKTTYTITATGEYGDAKRKIEAVYETDAAGAGYNGFPMAMFATGNIDMGSGVQINCTSVFSLGGSSGTNAITESSSPTIDGPDIYFGNWYNPPWNNVKRDIPTDNTGSNKTRNSEAGIGFVGRIDYSASTDSNTRVVTRRIDYSGVPSNFSHSSTPLFGNNPWAQDTDPTTTQPITGSDARISFPFDPRPEQQVKLRRSAGEGIGVGESLQAAAERQTGNYIETNSDYSFDSAAKYAKLNAPDKVVYIKFTSPGKKVEYKEAGNANCIVKDGGAASKRCPQGTLVIEDGTFNAVSSLGHEGTIIMRGSVTSEPRFQVGSDFKIRGFANVDGSMQWATGSKVYPLDVSQLASHFPFSGDSAGGVAVTLLPKSWRECYNVNCN